MVGTTIAHYQVTAKLGQGGMGEVYRAKDSKLDREVAIKVLPESFVRDPERLARFEREAKALAALNHRCIASIYGLESTGDSQALILELVEGVDLSEKLRAGALELGEALSVCRQIAEALEAAHEKGIIHRDLKPSNIKVTDEGQVIVLDFGLAKALAAESDSVRASSRATGVEGDGSRGREPHRGELNPDESPTLTADYTLPGVVLGTAGYMSPEQAKGKLLDKRSDIWSFGIVLFECLTGTNPFKGETVTDAIGASLHKEPDWSALPANTPATIQLLLRKCLAKERKQRLHDIADARIDLEAAIKDPKPPFFQSSENQTANSSEGTVSRGRAAAFALSAALLMAVLIFVLEPFAPREIPRSRPADLHFPGHYGLSTAYNTFVFTPSGDALIYNLSDLGSAGVFSRSLVENQADVSISGTDRAICMFMKPDGRWIGYNTFRGNSLRIAPIKEGPSIRLNPLKGIHPVGVWGGDWTETGQIVLAVNHEGNGLITIDEQGGDWVSLTELSDENETHSWPQALPGGRYILFGSHSGGENSEGAIEVVEVSSRERQSLFVPRGAFTKARYSPTGHLLFHVDGNVFAVSFDPIRLKVAGKPQPVIAGVWSGKENYSAQFDVSSRGDLVYLPDPGEKKNQHGLVWLQTDGRLEPATGVKADWGSSRTVLSQDASRIALDIEQDIWILDLESGQAAERLTFGAHLKTGPTWSLDDEWLYYVADEEDSQSLYRIRTDFSSNQPDLVYRHESEDLTLHDITSFTPTGNGYIVTVVAPNSANRIMELIRVNGGLQLQPCVELLPSENDAVPFAEWGGVVSPNGQWIAFNSARGVGRKVFVQRFDGEGTPRALPVKGGMNPTWARDGNQLYVESVSGIPGIYRVTFNTLNGNLEPHSFRAQKLMDLPAGVHLGQIEMSRAGDKAIIIDPFQTRTLKVIFDWATKLDRLTTDEP